MPSIQFKKSKTGKRTYYVVVSYRGKHKWIKAGTQKQAKELAGKIDSLRNSERLKKPGLATKDKNIDDFLQEYISHMKLRTHIFTMESCVW
ncbi:MAG: hypothetical protein V3V99_10570 [candidate division Zixibacteria bacterium]